MKVLRKYKRPTSNPNEGGKNYWPGWCDAAVRLSLVDDRGAGIPAKYGSAKASWDNAKRKHTNRNFPNAAVPIFYSLPGEPAGHVAVRLADGRVETTGLNDTFMVFASIQAFEQRWSSLKYLGWTEDLKDYDIITGYDPKPKPEPAPEKTTAQLADEVIAGLHGNGQARKDSLGNRYAVVQAEVNRRYAEQGEVVYVVKKGDSLSKIAEKHGVAWQYIYQKNRAVIGSNPSLIHAGQRLKI